MSVATMADLPTSMSSISTHYDAESTCMTGDCQQAATSDSVSSGGRVSAPSEIAFPGSGMCRVLNLPHPNSRILGQETLELLDHSLESAIGRKIMPFIRIRRAIVELLASVDITGVAPRILADGMIAPAPGGDGG